jgi:serine/threonine protein kinase/Tol biopolymer transport system component
MLAPGTVIGPYEILAFIGAGSMGEVYRARDSRLGRAVALKILPDTVQPDTERLARFRREAQLLASLNHPHISAVYGLEDAEGRLAIALELVDGEGLDARLARGPIAIEEAIAIARQIAEGLEAAHERGIVHRDLKPANVRLTAEGNVKILDFGLAKALEREAVEATSGMDAPTVARTSATAGMIVGTAAYMAPEQARGQPVDKRADIWAFGAVLYEMLAGRRPFVGETLSDTLAAVLTHDPDLSALPSTTPPAVRTLLARCLQRDVKLRLRDIGEARIALSRLPETAADAASSPAPRESPRARPFVLLIAAIAAIAIVSAALFLWSTSPSRSSDREAPLLTLGIDAGGDTAIAGVGWIGLNWVGPVAVLSPDGRTLVFIARGPSGGRWQLYARRLDELKASPVPGTEGAYAPFFSPDGNSIGFFAGGRLMKVTLNGGKATPICQVEEARGGAWSDDGTIIFAPRPEGPLYRVSSAGGTPSPATTLDSAAGETTHRWPQFLPGGKAFIFTAHGNDGAARGGDVIAQTAETRRMIHRGALFARYAASGHLLYVNDGKLFAAPFHPDRLELAGRAVPVADDVANALINGTAQFSVSNTGLLAYRRARSPNRLLQWMAPSGQVQQLRSVPAEYQEVRFSPTGDRLLLVIGEGAQSDIWVYDIARDAISRLTFYPDNDWAAIWSPDGTHVAYSSWRSDVGTFNLYLQRADGVGEPQRLTTSRNRQLAIEWHPDGKHILFSEERRDTGSDLMLLPIELTVNGEVRAGTPAALQATTANELAGEFSPDGKWLAYTSDESERNEVYVRPFRGRGGQWQVSTEGAEWVEWLKSGQLFYGRSEEVVMRVPYRIAGSTFVAENPLIWMRIPSGVSWVDPSPDGVRAAVIRAADARNESVVLVLNFFEHLRRVAPVGR